MSCWVCAALEIKQSSRDQPLIFPCFLSVFSLEAGFFVWADHQHFWLIWAQPSFLQVSQLAPVPSGVPQSWLNTSSSQIASKFIKLPFSFAEGLSRANVRADRAPVREVRTGSEGAQLILNQLFLFIYLNCSRQSTHTQWGAPDQEKCWALETQTCQSFCQYSQNYVRLNSNHVSASPYLEFPLTSLC